MSRLLKLLLGLLLLTACRINSEKKTTIIHHDKWSEYIINNESALNADLDRAIVNRNKRFPADSNYTEISIGFISHDTSLHDTISSDCPHIMQFTAYIRQIDECLLVSYTFYKDTSQRKIITLYKDYSRPCMVNIDSILSSVDTTEHFIVVKNEEPSIVDVIEIGKQSIQVRNLRFMISKRNSLYDIIVYINSESSNFRLTNEIKTELPTTLFGKELLVNKIGNVGIQFKSENENGIVTITGLQKTLLAQ